MSKRTGKVETTSYAAMLRRMIRAYGRRVGDADPADLAEMLALRAQLDDAIAEAVHTQRQRYGFSWADLARDLGITRQAAQQRWARRQAPSQAPAQAPADVA